MLLCFLIINPFRLQCGLPSIAGEHPVARICYATTTPLERSRRGPQRAHTARQPVLSLTYRVTLGQLKGSRFPEPGLSLCPPCRGGSLNHRTSREVPTVSFYKHRQMKPTKRSYSEESADSLSDPTRTQPECIVSHIVSQGSLRYVILTKS